MAKYRNHLPQLDGGVYLTDSGLETILVFHKKYDLPHFAAFGLLRDAAAESDPPIVALTMDFEQHIEALNY